MRILAAHITLCFLLTVAFPSCHPTKKFTANYYKEHEASLLEIRQEYKKLYDQRPFSLEFRDRQFQKLGLEILTDSIKYIYNFDIRNNNLTDTLKKYHFDETGVTGLVKKMQAAQCTWITNLDYYENRERKQLVFISIRHKDLATNKSEKYFTLAFFDNRQPFDEKQRLLDKTNRKNIRSINGEIFYRINDWVCYAFTGHFR